MNPHSDSLPSDGERFPRKAFSLFEAMNRRVPSLLPLLRERGGVRGTAINANQKLNRQGTVAATNLRFMGRETSKVRCANFDQKLHF
jgi:hypothetical protein